MGSLRLFNHQVRRVSAAVALLFATVMPAAVPALVSAATVTERSVTLSSSTKAVDNVSYEVKFTAQHAGTGAFIVDFCDSAAIGDTCTPVAGLSTTSVATSGGNTASSTSSGAGVKVILGSAVTVGDPVDVVLTGIHNPTNAGTMYARIVTYADDTAVGTNTSASPGTHYDDGSVALSITDGFNVGGSVLETLSFCASGTAFDTNGCTGTVTSPNVSLGTNGILGNTVSDGTIYSQVSTNAAHGAVVNLKSDATDCGGLMLEGVAAAKACNITPLTSAGPISQDAAKFGLKLGTIDNGTGTVGLTYGYSTSDYYMHYVAGNGSGVTSTYGDPIYYTSGEPVSKATVPLIFGANISNDTPAGAYKANLNLIATGTF